MLDSLGFVAHDRAERGTARAHFEEALTTGRETVDRRGISLALAGLADVTAAQGNYPAAQSLYEESLTLRREPGDPALLAAALNNLGDLALRQGAWEQAQTLFAEALTITQAIGTRGSIAWTLTGLGTATLGQGDRDAARAHFAAALAIRPRARGSAGHRRVPGGSRCGRRRSGQPEQAARLFGAAEALREAMGSLAPPVHRAEYDRHVSAARASTATEHFLAAWTAGPAMSLDQALLNALAEKSA